MYLIIHPDTLDCIEENEQGDVFLSFAEETHHIINLTLAYPLFKQLVEQAETLLKAMMIAKEEKQK